jgi:hypothetical protein
MILNAGKVNQYSKDDVYAIRDWLEKLIEIELNALENNLGRTEHLDIKKREKHAA